MVWLRGLGRVFGGCLVLALLIPGLAAWPAAWVDRGADGSARVSAFPIALTLLDPFVWACVRNSVAVAGLVAAGSLAIGVVLARIVAPWRFRGRSSLWALAMVPLAGGPLLVAPGVFQALDGPGRWEWLASRSILGEPVDDLVRWAALVWVGLAGGVPLVAMATASSLRRLEPSWTEAARAVGASRWRVWKDIAWPILRPRAARASAMVFTLALVEPAGPLVLGLRGTLAVQILGAAGRLDQPTRAASLAVLAIAIAGLVRVVVGWWGGAIEPEEEPREPVEARAAGFRQATISRLILLAWGLLAAGPVALLLLRAWRAGVEATAIASPWLGWLGNPEARAWAWNSATTAGLSVGLDLVILAALCRGPDGPGRRIVRLAARITETVPPLAMGVGALAVPWLVSALADASGRSPGSLALELSPARSPGILLILTLAAGRLPILARAAELARGLVRPVRVDAARVIGGSDRRALRAARGGWFGLIPTRALFLAAALASTNLAPALFLTPISGRRTLGPAVLGLVAGGGPIDPGAFGPVAAVLALNLAAFALATRSRIGPLGDWFRGG